MKATCGPCRYVRVLCSVPLRAGALRTRSAALLFGSALLAERSVPATFLPQAGFTQEELIRRAFAGDDVAAEFAAAKAAEVEEELPQVGGWLVGCMFAGWGLIGAVCGGQGAKAELGMCIHSA